VSDSIIQYAIVSVNEERKSMAASSFAIDRFLRPQCEYTPDARNARIGAAKPAQSDERCDGEDKAGIILSVMERSYPLMLAFNCYWKAVFVVGRILHCAACCDGLASFESSFSNQSTSLHCIRLCLCLLHHTVARSNVVR
jgi:hypothetical protein